MKRTFQVTLSVAVAALVLHTLLRGFDGQEIQRLLHAAEPGRLLAAGALMVLAYLVRAARWTIWESSLTYWNSLRLILIGFMGNNVLPARLGEVLRAHCTAAKTSYERGRTTALASIAAERVFDGLTLGVLGLVGLALVPVDPRLQTGLFAVSCAFAGLMAALVCGLRSHATIRSWVAAAHRKFPGHVTAVARQRSNQFLDGVLMLATRSRMLAALGISSAIWTIELMFYYQIGLAVWGEMRLSVALMFLVTVNFASLVPFTIGGIGSIEAVAPWFLISAGIPAHPAFAMVVLQHASQYIFTTVAGGVLYFAGGFHLLSVRKPHAPRRTPRRAQAVPSPIIDEARSTLGRLGASGTLRPVHRGQIALSIVIPAYNEQSRLPHTVLDTLHWCSASGLDFEIVIADDGSADQTLALARLFEESDQRVRTIACPHMGKGATVRMGVLNARGRAVLFMDADGATPLDEIPRLLAVIASGRPIAIGSRVAQHPGDTEVTTSLHRRLIGRVFAFLVNVVAVDGIADTQCGFKMFDREAALALFSRQRLTGFAFDVEILFLARQFAMPIVEIPVNWTAQAGSKVSLIADSLRMLRDILQIKWLHRSLSADASAAVQAEQTAAPKGLLGDSPASTSS